jgi:hypothetical protein
MPSDMTLVIADPTRIAAIQKGLALPGRALWFPSNKLSSALDSIQMNHPKVIAVDALIAETPQGRTLLERLDQMTFRGCGVQLVVRSKSGWAIEPYHRESPAHEEFAAAPAVAAPEPRAAVAPAAPVSTRRADRFRVVEPQKAAVEGQDVTLVNLSVLGVQVTSARALRPNQLVKVAIAGGLPDLTAQIAWATLEQATERTEAYYRAGMAFEKPAEEMLQEYCRNHCSDQPLPKR